jgi:hypothetical protein
LTQNFATRNKRGLETTNKDKYKQKINHLKSILQTERTRELYRRISTKITPNQQLQPRLQVQHQDLSVVEITDTLEMASHIAEYNKLHFIQARDTPLSTYKSSFINSESTEKSSSVFPDTTQMETVILNNKAYLQQQFESNTKKTPPGEKSGSNRRRLDN